MFSFVIDAAVAFSDKSFEDARGVRRPDPLACVCVYCLGVSIIDDAFLPTSFGDALGVRKPEAPTLSCSEGDKDLGMHKGGTFRLGFLADGVDAGWLLS